MKIHYSFCFLIFNLVLAPASAQVISWVDHSSGMNTWWVHLYYKGLSTVDGTGVMCAFQAPDPSLRTYDWQGVVVNELPMPRPHYLRQIDDGHIIAGSFQFSAEVLGTSLEGGAGYWDAYLARLHSDGTLAWMIRSISHAGPNLALSRVAASPSGRIALLFGPSGTHEWGEDTVPALAAGRLIRVYDGSGALTWSKRLSSQTNSMSWYGDAELAINDAGEVWLSGLMPHDLIVDTDTIVSLTPYGRDQLIARFSPEGTMTGHMVVAGWDPGPGLVVRSLLAWPDGRLFWAGSFRSGTVIGDTTLFTSGPGQGMLMEISPDMSIGATSIMNSQNNTSLSAITGDPSSNTLLLAGVCGRDASFEDGSMDIDAEYTAFLIERNMNGGVNSWTPLVYTNDTNGFVWPLNVVERNGIIHMNGYREGQVREMDGTVLSPGNGFLIRFDNANSVSIQTADGPLSQLTCWPSPTLDILNVGFDTEGTIDYQIVSADGRLADHGQWSAITGPAQLNVGHLAAGTYVLKVNSRMGMAAARFVVE